MLNGIYRSDFDNVWADAVSLMANLNHQINHLSKDEKAAAQWLTKTIIKQTIKEYKIKNK